MTRRARWLVSSAAALALAGGWLATRPPREVRPSAHVPPPPSASAALAPKPTPPPSGHKLTPPTGAPPQLTCDEAKRVIAQARGLLAATPPAIDPRAFADGVVDWLDPHGLWSAAPDAPAAPIIKRRARELLAELEAPRGFGECRSAGEIGGYVGAWVRELRWTFVAASRAASAVPPARATELALTPAFEDGPITRPSRELARELGGTLGTLERSLPGFELVARAAVDRALPADGVEWDKAVLAAAVHAYVPLIDPHGGWAPLTEETSLYEIELEASPPPRLWRKMSRTAAGVKIDEAEVAGLPPGSLVLAVGDVPTAGLGVEQVEQLSYVDVDPDAPSSHRVTVLGANGAEEREITVGGRPASDGGGRHGELVSQLVPYAGGHVLVASIEDVPDTLGEDLIATLQRARAEALVVGVLLDLRGNGGGSTDGAAAALGVFLPGATLFPLRRRDGAIEVERASSPPAVDRWTGPLATLVDGDTASAAEMIAGALASYRRAPVIGERTFGKGCAQEYLDDEARVGVLRLTTLLYSLPDGSPVQLSGIAPSLRLPLPKSGEREASLRHPAPAWHGPDVRDMTQVREVPWPGHGGAVGPCDDAAVCKAVRALGAPRAPVARGR
ncbi:MAG: S41 family peptidase [Polyangiaceae bacterium]|nr:S41 family peptidase [Polyangiaceae bacterium]